MKMKTPNQKVARLQHAGAMAVRTGTAWAAIAGLILITILAAQTVCSGQGTLTITFDGPPDPYGRSVIPYYVESGMYFGSEYNGFGHSDSGLPGFPDDGTRYLDGAGHGGYNSFGASFTTGSTFGVASVDLAAFGGSSTNISAEFGGSRSDGTNLHMSVSGTGIDFRTIYFGPEWSSGLTVFAVANSPSSPDGWSVDNLVVIVPEPGCGALLVSGLAVLAFWRRKWRERST